jgi:hypothetical protein
MFDIVVEVLRSTGNAEEDTMLTVLVEYGQRIRSKASRSARSASIKNNQTVAMSKHSSFVTESKYYETKKSSVDEPQNILLKKVIKQSLSKFITTEGRRH